MKLLRPGIYVIALLAAACGDGSDGGPKFIGDGTGGRNNENGGKTSTGGRSSGGSGGETGGGGNETGGVDGGATGGTSGAGGAGTGGTSGSGGAGGTSTGGTGGTGSGGAPETCTLATGNEGCDGCIYRSCMTECSGCEGQAECAAIVDCTVDNCFTAGGLSTSCVMNCRHDHPSGDQSFINLVFNCGKSSCSTFCPFL